MKEIINGLEQIGLTSSEVKVYLALLRLGTSSTGPIIRESKTADSKIYEVLDKLSEKGLVSFFIKDNVKQYQPASPRMVLEYLRVKKQDITEQENQIEKILPGLLNLQSEKKTDLSSNVFVGNKGIKTAFMNLVDELNSGDEVHIMGVHNFDDRFKPLALFFQRIRSVKGIKAKFLMNQNAKPIAKLFRKYPPVEIRFMKENILTPSIFLIYSNKVIINMPQELTFFVLESDSVKKTFEEYFQILWKNSSIKN
ncbi:MAG: TrmB family transcriptional regulator [Candidatus Woesearchaeota archaeon]